MEKNKTEKGVVLSIDIINALTCRMLQLKKKDKYKAATSVKPGVEF